MSLAASILSLEERPRAVLYILLMMMVVLVILESRDFEKQDISLSPEGRSILNTLDRCDGYSYVPSRGSVAWWMVCSGNELFGNSRVVPFIVSLGIVPMTYLLGARMTGRRLCGLFSAGALCINPVYLIFNSVTIFHQIWVLFLISSFYFMYRQPYLAGPLFILSVMSKALPVLFYPGIMVFIWKSGFDKKRKATLYITYTGITAFVLGFTFGTGNGIFIEPSSIVFDPDITDAFSSLYWNLTKFTSHIMVPVLVVLCAWLLRYRKWPALAMICTMIGIIPILDIFTVYTTFPYRLVPLMVFTSIGVSYIIFSRLVKSRRTLESIYSDYLPVR